VKWATVLILGVLDPDRARLRAPGSARGAAQDRGGSDCFSVAAVVAPRAWSRCRSSRSNGALRISSAPLQQLLKATAAALSAISVSQVSASFRSVMLDRRAVAEVFHLEHLADLDVAVLFVRIGTAHHPFDRLILGLDVDDQ